MIEAKVAIAYDKGPLGAGGVQLEAEALYGAMQVLVTDCKLLSINEVSNFLDARTPSLVFAQQSGDLGRSHVGMLEDWLEMGAWVVEKNVFALPSLFRPSSPRYVMALLSMDGAARLRLRSALSIGTSMPSRYLLYPNPRLSHVGPDVPSHRHTADQAEVRILRVGRPDPIKWTRFELDFVRMCAMSDRQRKYKLTLLGAPTTMVESTHDVPDNMTLDFPGYVDNPSIYYRQSHVYLHMSRIGETYGNVIFESLGLGIPCLLAVDPKWDAGFYEYLNTDLVVARTPETLLRSPRKWLDRALSSSTKNAAIQPSTTEAANMLTEFLTPSPPLMTPMPSIAESRRHISQLKRALTDGEDSSNLDVALFLAAQGARRLIGSARG